MRTFRISTVRLRMICSNYLSIPGCSGGQLDLSKKYVGELPIPNLTNMGLSDLSEFIRTGSEIVEGKARWEEVDELVSSSLSK